MPLIRQTVPRSPTGAFSRAHGRVQLGCKGCSQPKCTCGGDLIKIAGSRPVSFQCKTCGEEVGLIEIVKRTRSTK